MSNWLDLGDRCIYCGRSTLPDIVTFIQRVPVVSEVNEWTTWAAEHFQAGTLLKGYGCDECMSKDDDFCRCEACHGSCRGYADDAETKLCDFCSNGECPYRVAV